MREEDKREKEIRYLLFLKNELIKQTKKEVKSLRNELNEINDAKTLRRKRENGTNRR